VAYPPTLPPEDTAGLRSAPEEGEHERGGSARIVVARAFGPRRSGSDAAIAQIAFALPDETRVGGEACRSVPVPTVAAASETRGLPSLPTITARPSVTVTTLRGRAPVDVGWAFPTLDGRAGSGTGPTPIGKTLVQLALYEATPSDNAAPVAVVQCTADEDSIALAVPRSAVDELLAASRSGQAVVRISVARAPGRAPTGRAARPATPPWAIGAYVDLGMDK
jgi:hypothetical protein